MCLGVLFVVFSVVVFFCFLLGFCVFFCLLVCFVLILSRYVFTPFVLLLSHELHLSDDCVIILVYFPFSILDAMLRLLWMMGHFCS